jgi:peptide/nickel transport system substrate-binding protein
MGISDRMLSRRKLLGTAAALGLSAPAAAMLPLSRAGVAAAVEELNLIQGADIITLDGNEHLSMHNSVVIQSFTDRLVQMSKTNYGELEPMLATSWEEINPTLWRFKLRDGVKFHTGQEMTADDVAYSINRYVAGGLWESAVAMTESAAPVDKYTVEVTLKYPSALFLYGLNVTTDIIPAGWGESADFSPEVAVGTGPYKFVEWVKGQHVLGEANPDYWMGAPPAPRVRWVPVPEGSTRVANLVTGEGSIVRQIPPQDIPRVDGADAYIATIAGNRCFNILINDELEPTNNQTFRQALVHAVDVSAIIQVILSGLGTPLQGQPTGPTVRGWNPNVQAYAYDPDRSKALLEEVGYDGQPILLDTSRGRYAQDVEVNNAVAGMLKNVGINCEVVINETAEYAAKFAHQAPSNHLFFTSSGNAIPDIENAFNDLLHGFTVPQSPSVHDPEFEALRDKLAETTDPAEREKLGYEGVQWLHDYVKAINLYQQEDVYGVNAAIEWSPRPDEWILIPEIKIKEG